LAVLCEYGTETLGFLTSWGTVGS